MAVRCFIDLFAVETREEFPQPGDESVGTVCSLSTGSAHSGLRSLHARRVLPHTRPVLRSNASSTTLKTGMSALGFRITGV